MNRRDLDAAGGVEDRGEELPGSGHDRVVGMPPRQLLQLLCELCRGQRRPFGQPLVEPVGHLRGGRARKGQAQDAGGIRAVEHQTQQPVGQHLGLAGAGRGRDPDRDVGSRRVLLGRMRIGRLDHSSSPLAAIRSRWRYSEKRGAHWRAGTGR